MATVQVTPGICGLQTRMNITADEDQAVACGLALPKDVVIQIEK